MTLQYCGAWGGCKTARCTPLSIASEHATWSCCRGYSSQRSSATQVPEFLSATLDSTPSQSEFICCRPQDAILMIHYYFAEPWQVFNLWRSHAPSPVFRRPAQQRSKNWSRHAMLLFQNFLLCSWHFVLLAGAGLIIQQDSCNAVRLREQVRAVSAPMIWFWTYSDYQLNALLTQTKFESAAAKWGSLLERSGVNT